jgi:adenylate cyclase
MSIRLKIIFIVLPLLVVTLLITGIFSYFSASYAISRIARDFLGFKADQLSNQAASQWNLLVEANLTARTDMVDATKAAVGGYALNIIRSPTELILALAEDGTVAMSTSPVAVQKNELPALLSRIKSRSTDLATVSLGGKERVVKGFWFDPFKWYIVVSEERATFYSQVNEITRSTAIILVASLILATVLILVFASYLTRPLTRVANTMKDIISTNDLSQRVVVEYRDEIGSLAQTFNLMVEELEKAYGQIKSFAFKAVLARKREQKIKNLFQKYVPKDVIEQIYANPESALVGENRVVAILFSDIRDFTSISEKMMPDDLVSALNRYFTVMVDIIMAKGGIVDKYIGDAIMACFGATVRHPDDALQSVMAGIEMVEGLSSFNAQQANIGKPPFRIGVGINYGVVTVGNIGTEKKMDYTVIGDMVNLASRLEGLTKEYRQEIIISESLHKKVGQVLPCRLIDSVVVKGKTRGERIYTTKRELSEAESQAWELHNAAMEEYYKRNFADAAGLFQNVRIIMPDDYASEMMLERCRRYEKNPPLEDWVGIEVMTHK